MIKTYAWQQLTRVKYLQNLYSRSTKKQEQLENQTIGELIRLYNTKQMELRRTSTEFEMVMGKVMECAGGKYTEAFKEAILTNSNLEHAISQILL